VRKAEEIISKSQDETKSLGAALGKLLSGGEILGLEGELGAGKTCFIQGLARGLGVSESEYVRSPTFTIINEYSGRVPLYHFDLYRLGNVGEIDSLGYEEYFGGKGVVAIEWFEKMPPADFRRLLNLRIDITDDNERKLYFWSNDIYYRAIFRKFLSMSAKKEGP
jgi:tRNA threonylcarbamoyladenosine biosynthesis protein TsaE